MVVAKLRSSDLIDLDTRQRIMEVAIHFFALKGFDGASIREIAKLAQVNVSSLNYHFKTKENLRKELMSYVADDFRTRLRDIPKTLTAAEYAVKVFETLTADSAKCLNQFKLILDSENHPCEEDPVPLGYEVFSEHLSRELHPSVPMQERLWLASVVFGYVMHVSVMCSTKAGKRVAQKFFPGKEVSLPIFISQLVESLVRDLNSRYAPERVFTK